MRNAKPRPKTRLDKRITSWQELVDNYRTFATDIKCDIKRVQELLDTAENMNSGG